MTKPRYKTQAVKTRKGKNILITNWVNPNRTDFYYKKEIPARGEWNFKIHCIFNDEIMGWAYDYLDDEETNVERKFINMIKVRNVIRRLKIST